MSVNKTILVGRLGKDPELKTVGNDTSVVNFTLATNRSWKGKDEQASEETTWHNITAWGKQAEIMAKYLVKGNQVYLEGRISNRSYDDKEGNKRYVSEVVVENFTFLGGKGDAPATVDPDNGAAPTTDDNSDLPF